MSARVTLHLDGKQEVKFRDDRYVLPVDGRAMRIFTVEVGDLCAEFIFYMPEAVVDLAKRFAEFVDRVRQEGI